MNWPNFDTVVSQGIGRSRERERDGEQPGIERWKHTSID